MLTEICQYLRNWFDKVRYFGGFMIRDGVITFVDGSEVPLLKGQYYRVAGSIFNDGVHQYGVPLEGDEEFTGAVWGLAIPREIIELSEEIDRWIVDNAEAIASPYQSESFGGYSYSKSSGYGSSSVGSISWQSQFAARLAPWRKI